MGTFFKALFSANDPAGDSIVVCGIILTVALVAFTGWDIARGHDFGPWAFATSGGAIIAAVGGGKMLRAKGES